MRRTAAAGARVDAPAGLPAASQRADRAADGHSHRPPRRAAQGFYTPSVTAPLLALLTRREYLASTPLV